MPELPEIETIVQELKPIVTGETILKIQVYWQKTLNVNVRTFQKILSNATIQNINRRGKYIYFILDNDWRLLIHLGMSGKLLFQLGKKDKKYLRVKFALTHNLMLYFTDVRKFGRMNIEPTNKPLLPNLGPEPLNPEIILKNLRNLNTQRAIKSILLDQQILAGIGNIYADEALFRANIHPITPKSKLNQKTLHKLSKEIPEVLKEAIRNRGTTISDYNLPDLIKGKNQFFLKVYGRTHQPCLICKSLIHRIRISGRSSHFCPRCQPEIKH